AASSCVTQMCTPALTLDPSENDLSGPRHALLQATPGATPGRLLVVSGLDASPQTCIAISIRDIGKEAWNACFPDEIEDYDYLLAIEQAGMEGFVWRYVALLENGRVIAAMPMFLTDYPLETTIESKTLR